MMLSILFLIATISVYVYVKGLRADVAGKSLICFLSSLTMVFVSLLIDPHAVEFDLVDANQFLFYFSSMLTFLWMGALSFDIWWTFK